MGVVQDFPCVGLDAGIPLDAWVDIVAISVGAAGDLPLANGEIDGPVHERHLRVEDSGPYATSPGHAAKVPEQAEPRNVRAGGDTYGHRGFRRGFVQRLHVPHCGHVHSLIHDAVHGGGGNGARADRFG